MRHVIAAMALGLLVLALWLPLARCSLTAERQLHNAYWPFSVEMQVKDC